MPRSTAKERIRALRERRWQRLFGPRLEGPPKPKGFVVLQIDALAGWVLEEAMRRRRARFLRSLQRHGGARLSRFRVGLPCTTPSFQAGFLYGTRGEIPGFRWYERRTGETVWFAYPWDCARIEHEFRDREGLLAGGGSSYFNIFTGGADNHPFDSAALTFERGRRRRLFANFFRFLFYLTMAGTRVFIRTVFEIARETFDVLAGLVRRRRGRRWGQFLLRALSNAFLNELTVVGIREEVRRGTRYLYANFLGYDKAAHARGPTHPYALWSVREVDRDLRRIFRAVRRIHRRYDYDFYVLSDHGIVGTIPIEDEEGQDFESALLRAREASASGTAGDHVETAAELTRSLDLLQEGTALFPPFARRLITPFRRRVAKRLRRPEGVPPAGTIPRVVLRPTGNLAHVYLVGSREPIGYEDLETRAAGLLDYLDRSPYVRVFAARGAAGEIVLGGRGKRARASEGACPTFDLGAWEVEEISRLVRMERSGDLVLFAARVGNEVYNFQRELASHGGFEPEEQDGFVLAPAGVDIPASALTPEGLHAFFRERYRAPARERAPEPQAVAG